MTLDRTFTEQNRAATQRMGDLAARLSEDQMNVPVGEHWVVSIVFAHLAFWDRRVLFILEETRKQHSLFKPQVDEFMNDLLLPFWAAIPPRQAVHLAIETAEALDERLASFPHDLLEEVYAYNQRWVVRALHRNEHLDDAEEALRASGIKAT